MKKRISLLMGLILLFTLAFSISPVSMQALAPVEVVIFHTNDVHARATSDAGMGYALAAKVVNAERAAGKNVLLLDAGDTLHGQTIATLVKGQSIIDIMNTMGYDAMTPGNHDFNYGFDQLKHLSQQAQFPIISANLIDKAADKPAFAPYIIKEFDGVKIGIVGAQSPEIAIAIHPDYIQNVDFAGYYPVRRTVNEIKDQTDAIIILAHWGDKGVDIPSDVLAQIDGVDLVIDGHSHSMYANGRDAFGTYIVSTGEYLNNLGKVTMSIDAAGNVSVQPELITAPQVEPDAQVQEVIAHVQEQQAILFAEKVGHTDVALDGERAQVRTRETNLANLITDAILANTGADVVLTNGGGIRASIDKGTITKGEVITVLPFGNTVVTKEVTGKNIRLALEHGLRFYPDQNGGFAQVAGMRYTFDPSRSAGERVVDVTVGSQPLVDDQVYVLATNDFMAAGGDGYTMLGESKTLFDFGSMDDVLMKYLSKNPSISPIVDGRIQPLN